MNQYLQEGARMKKSINLNEVLLMAGKLSNEIGELLSQSTYKEYDDLSELEIDYKDPEQLFIVDELRYILEKLDMAKDAIDYLNCPVKYSGTLIKNSRGRYEIKQKEYTCGSSIEALVTDNYHDEPYWTRTRVEHDGLDYYLVGNKNIQMKGLKVRVR
jgi:hypothetical protein